MNPSIIDKMAEVRAIEKEIRPDVEKILSMPESEYQKCGTWRGKRRAKDFSEI